jgi:poly-gamma-glutamate capsule biosynthesis protein CapA/YwtB (metallophosphatase superfamily)
VNWSLIGAHGLLLGVLVIAGCSPQTTPERTSEGTEPPHLADSPLPEIQLLAVGDVNLGRQCGQYLLAEGEHYPFGHLRGWIESFDLAFCNLESNISDQNGETVHPVNRLIFTAPPPAAAALKNSGWDLVSTANNHSADYGLASLKETISHLRDAGILFNGTALEETDLYEPTFVTVKECRIAFLAVTDVTNGPCRGTSLERHLNLADPEKLLPGLERAEQEADFTILSYHGGHEYWDQPTPETRGFLKWAIDQGVDLVIGHHPHVIQGLEWYRERLILYSLGNFTFYQGGTPYWTDYGVAAVISFNRDGIVRASFIPTRAHFQAQIIRERPLADRVLARLTALSQKIASPSSPR